MNKKGLVFAFSVFGAVTLGIVGMAGFAASKGQSVFSKASAENVVYKLNTNFNAAGVYETNVDPTIGAAGDAFNGKDGYHFVVTKSNGTDWHIKMHNFGGDWSLIVDKEYTITYEFKFDAENEKDTYNLIATARWREGVKDAELWHEGDYAKGVYHTVTENFVNKTTDAELEFQLGKNKGAFKFLMRRIEVKEKESGAVVAACYFEAPGEFRDRWNTAHEEKGLCNASDDTVKALLKLYTELPAWARNDVRGYDATQTVEGKGTKLGDQIDYFAERVHVSFE